MKLLVTFLMTFNEKMRGLGLMVALAFAGAVVAISSALADGPVVPAGSAPAAPGAPLTPPAPGFASMLLPFAAMFGVVYFLMIRPQQKKMKEQQDMLGQLKQGDEIVTSSGILGTVRGLTEKVVTIEIDDDVKIKVLKSQVSQVVKGSLKDLTA